LAQEKPNRLAEWLTLARRNAPVARQRFAEWWEAVREEPRLAWESYLVRYPAYALGGLLVVFLVSTAIGFISPPLPRSAQPSASTADFHVVCTEPACGHRFVINRGFGFDDFPVTCPKCRKLTGHAARPCYSTSCNGRWVAPVKRDDGPYCPICAARLP